MSVSAFSETRSASGLAEPAMGDDGARLLLKPHKASPGDDMTGRAALMGGDSQASPTTRAKNVVAGRIRAM